MTLRGIICALLIACAACRGGAETQPLRAACSANADCGAGLTCTSGYCVSPLPTVSQYRACSFDVDCPAADHCDLGACTHDCVADRDCQGAQTCDLRGRCATAEMAAPSPAAAPAPAAPTAPVLRVGEAHVAFETFGETRSLTVKNEGNAPLSFRIIADATWLDATPVTGTVSSGSSATVTVAARSAGTGTHATISVVSTGGSSSIPVSVPATLAGLYQGQVHITSPSDLGTRAFAIRLAQDASGPVRGVIDDARSPAFGFRAPLDPTSTIDDQSVSLKFAIPGRPGSGGNPSYPQSLRRTITINGKVAAGGGISGVYTESLEGATAAPVVISGTVDLSAVDRAATLLPPQTDAVEVQPATAPAFLACDICPKGICPADHVLAGRAFLEAAFKFYASPLADGTGDAYAPIRACVDSPASCYDPIALHCAQAHFYQAVTAAGTQSCPDGESGDCAQRGLLDTFKGLLTWNTLSGNEHMVRAYALGRTLDEQRTELDAARSAFATGLLGANKGGARVAGMLDPFFFAWVMSLPASQWSTARPSRLPEQLGVGDAPKATSTVAPFGDFDRLGAALDLWIEALRNELGAHHKLNADDPEDLVLAAGRDAADAHVVLALAATLHAHVGAPDKLAKAVGHASQLASKVGEIGAGLNPAGYPDSYIAYTYAPALGATSNNYLKLWEDFNARWLASASSTFNVAQGTQREFESTYQQINLQLVATNADYGKRVADLCGGSATAPSLASCGGSAGQIFDTLAQIQSANLRMQNAVSAVSNQYEQITIEENRAAEQVHLHQVTAQAITEDGHRLELLQDRETRLEEGAALFGGIFGALSDPKKALASVASGAVNAVIAYGKGDIDKERIKIDTIAKARVEYDQAQSQLIDSAARVKALMLEIPTLRINAMLAQQDIARLVGQLRSQWQEAQDAMTARNLMLQLASSDPRRDPAFRQYRDQTTALANKAFDDAQGQLFLVTRALEYEIGMSFGRRSELFTLVTPAELASYATDLDAAYQRFTTTVGNSQDRETTISLRDQVFRFSTPLADNVTGGSYSPAEIFRRVLAEPRNRDADGNVRLTFALPLTPDAPFFNPSYCTDKITGIRISLVGATLGATQPEVGLQQRGSAYLRSCTDKTGAGDYVVSEYNLENTIGVRRAIVQAGLNLSSPTDMSSGGPDNTEFYGRPVAAPYELIIDRKAPANAELDLTKLDDIVLFIRHQTRTVH